MPVSAHLDYKPVLDEFLAHWAMVDSALGADPIVLAQGLNRAGLQALRGDLATKFTDFTHLENDLELAGGSLALRKTALLGRIVQFNGVVRAWWHGQPLGEVLPLAPSVGAAPERYLQVARHILWLWNKLNGSPAPTGITLPLRLGANHDYGRPEFLADVTAFDTDRIAHETADLELALWRAQRDTLERTIHQALVAYARSVIARLGPDAALTHTLPRLTPPQKKRPKPQPTPPP